MTEASACVAAHADDELRDLFGRSLATHRAWVAEGRP